MKKRKTKLSKKKIGRIIKRIFYTGIIAAILFVVFTGVRFWIANSDIFYVSKIEVSGTKVLSIKEIEDLVTIAPGSKIFDVDLDSISAKVHRNPFILKSAIGRKYPSTIKIEIKERIPAAYVVLEKVYYTDMESVLLPKRLGTVNYTDLPIITGVRIKNPVMGKNPESADLDKTLEFLKTVNSNLPELYENISEVHLNKDGGISIILSGSGLKIECGENKFELKLARLKYFMEYKSQEGELKNLVYINLNYDDMIVIKD